MTALAWQETLNEKAAPWPESSEPIPVPAFYYIQDSRRYVGNSAVWWRERGEGYTTNLTDAMKVTGDWKGRTSDILWPVHEIDALSRSIRQFDVQNFRDIRKKYVPLPEEDDSCLCNGRGCARCCGPA